MFVRVSSSTKNSGAAGIPVPIVSRGTIWKRRGDKASDFQAILEIAARFLALLGLFLGELFRVEQFDGDVAPS
jgi:hypothetical protein